MVLNDSDALLLHDIEYAWSWKDRRRFRDRLRRKKLMERKLI